MYQESINVITAVSKLLNIDVIQAENYNRTEKSICDNVQLNCSVHLVINDNMIFEQARQRIDKKRLKAQTKLENLIKMTSSKKYEADKSENEKLKDQEKVLLNIN